MPKVSPPGRKQEYVKVIKTDEKGTDVNRATRLRKKMQSKTAQRYAHLANDTLVAAANVANNVVEKFTQDGASSAPASRQPILKEELSVKPEVDQKRTECEVEEPFSIP